MRHAFGSAQSFAAFFKIVSVLRKCAAAIMSKKVKNFKVAFMSGKLRGRLWIPIRGANT